MSGSEVLASIGQMSIISRGFRLALLVACLVAVAAAVHWRHRRWRLVGTAVLALVLLGANARIESRGRGAQNEAQTVGWIARFFMAFLPF